MKKSLLKAALDKKSLIGIRTSWLDWDESIIGFIISIDDSCFTIKEIDEYGFFIGQSIIEIDDIINIETNDRYQQRLSFIHENNSKFNSNIRYTIWKVGSDLVAYFDLLIEKKQIVTLFFDDNEYVTCIALEYDEDFLQVQNIGREGDEDGISCYALDQITGLRYNSLEEQKIKLLYANRHLFS